MTVANLAVLYVSLDYCMGTLGGYDVKHRDQLPSKLVHQLEWHFPNLC